MRKAFMGVRLKRLREERGLTQIALARALELSPSYLNQLEKNERPLTVPVLLKINAVFGVDVQLFSESEEARLIADLRDALSVTPMGEKIALAEIRELASNMPAVGRALVAMHRRYREVAELSEAMAARLGDNWQASAPQPMPFEEVRDFFYTRHNYIPELDEFAERLYAKIDLSPGTVNEGLAEYLSKKHSVRVVTETPENGFGVQRQYDRSNKILHLSAHLRPGQQVFHMATQLAFLEIDDLMSEIGSQVSFLSSEAASLLRIGLANYFAGALILPYAAFLKAAEEFRYDIERLSRHFGVGYETVSHRLSTLQRPAARGVPFFLIRVDRAGNISKRQSATDFHFSRVGGTCPLWNVYEAFAQPGRILTQLAQMPDGRVYLWIARTVSRSHGEYGAPGKTFSIGMGCDIRHASRLVYSKGLNLDDLQAATPIGAGCKICERTACPQRAFPSVGRPLRVDESHSFFAPYAAK